MRPVAASGALDVTTTTDFFNGRFEKPIEPRVDTPEARAGLACTNCHAISYVDSIMGNNGFTIEYPALHELMPSKNQASAASGLHDLSRPATPPRDVPEPVYETTGAGILLPLPQRASRYSGEQLHLVPRIQ